MPTADRYPLLLSPYEIRGRRLRNRIVSTPHATGWSRDGQIARNRQGCFVNSEGYGNYRATLPGANVYVGLLGRTADTGSLDDWAWFGNEDTPGIPTLWQQDFAYRP